jgi:predicted dehydrogenase
MGTLRGVVIGAGYFSAFHQEAWSRIPEVKICAVCDLVEEKVHEAQRRFHLPSVYMNWRDMLEAERPDFVDIVTPPHYDICAFAPSARYV